jgi:hypothetical protein
MASSHDPFSRWNFHSRLTGPSLSLLRDRHVLGCDCQRSREHNFIRGGTPSYQTLQIYLYLLLPLHCNDDCWRSCCTLGVAYQRLCRYLSFVYHCCGTLHVACCIEPRTDDVYLVNAYQVPPIFTVLFKWHRCCGMWTNDFVSLTPVATLLLST